MYFMFFYLIGLGSNICPQENLPRALKALENLGKVQAYSPVVSTVTVGHTFSGSFCNQLVVLASALAPQPLKQHLLDIETHMGREPKTPQRQYHDRTIDLDILAQDGSAEQVREAVLSEIYYRQIQQLWNKCNDQEVNV